MEKSEKVRRGPLREAVKLLAYRNAMQSDPLLLLFLQNVADTMNTHRVVVSSLQKTVSDVYAALGRVTARVNAMEDRDES